jgi:hypothetical protein
MACDVVKTLFCFSMPDESDSVKTLELAVIALGDHLHVSTIIRHGEFGGRSTAVLLGINEVRNLIEVLAGWLEERKLMDGSS